MNRTILLTALLLILAAQIGSGQIPQTISYQGVLTDASGALVTDGNYYTTFKFYDAAGGGSPIWTESQSVTVTKGIFNVVLGSVNPLALSFDAPYWLGITVGSGAELTPRVRLTSAPYSLNANKVKGSTNIFPSEGKVGIGTGNPGEKLEVTGKIYSSQGGFKFPDGTVQTTASSGGSGGVADNLGNHTATQNIKLNGHWLSKDGGDEGVFVDSSGSVGIGTNSPTSRFSIVQSGASELSGTAMSPVFKVSNGKPVGLTGSRCLGSFGFHTKGTQNNNVALGIHGGQIDEIDMNWTGSAVWLSMDVDNTRQAGPSLWLCADNRIIMVGGKVQIQGSSGTVMELGEGLDYAEGFDVSEKTDISPGTVLVIDTDSPGKLKQSEHPYDRRVAGIVSGAKGLGTAIRVGGDASDFDVALAGRVYCNVDATMEGVEPGDLLTTSSSPGFAMKVADYQSAQGAILGKAMEPLEKGKKGQILVLVTLQ